MALMRQAYDTIEEFNVDSKAEYSALCSARSLRLSSVCRRLYGDVLWLNGAS